MAYVNKKDIEVQLRNDPRIAGLLEKKEIKGVQFKEVLPSQEVLRPENSKKATRDFLQLFPDMDNACDIMVAMVTSPRSAGRAELQYGLSGGVTIPPNISSRITRGIRSAMRSKYHLDGNIAKYLKTCIAGDGAVAFAVIPESTLSSLLGSADITTESASKLLNLSNEKTLGLVNNNPKAFIQVTDNFNILQYGLGKAGRDKITLESKIYGSFVKKEKKEDNNVVKLTEAMQNRADLSRPLVLSLDVKQIRPVILPGKPEEHVGYLVPVNRHGQLASDKLTNINVDEAYGKLLKENIVGTDIIAKAKAGRAEMKRHHDQEKATTQIKELFREIIENTVEGALIDGSISVSDETFNMFYETILARYLSKKETKILYLPKSLVSYFAIQYDGQGNGRNSIEDINILSSLRAMLLYSTLGAEVRNNLLHSEVSVTIDPKSVDPEKDYTAVISEIRKAQTFQNSIGLSDPDDFSAWITNGGLRINLEEHPSLPGTKFTYEQIDGTRNVDRESWLLTEIRKLQMQAIGPGVEMVDSGFDGDFASTAEARKLMLAKKTIAIQDPYAKQLTDHVKRIVRGDGPMFNDFFEYILNDDSLIKYLSDEEQVLYKEDKEAFCYRLLYRIIDDIQVTFPNPDTTSLSDKSEEFDNYRSSLESVLEAWLSEDVLDTELFSGVADKIPAYIALVRAHYLRKWCSENDYFLELSSLTELRPDGSLLLDMGEVNTDHSNTILMSLTSFIKEELEEREVEENEVDENEDVTDTGTDADPVEEDTSDGDDIDLSLPGADETV